MDDRDIDQDIDAQLVGFPENEYFDILQLKSTQDQNGPRLFRTMTRMKILQHTLSSRMNMINETLAPLLHPYLDEIEQLKERMHERSFIVLTKGIQILQKSTDVLKRLDLQLEVCVHRSLDPWRWWIHELSIGSQLLLVRCFVQSSIPIWSLASWFSTIFFQSYPQVVSIDYYDVETNHVETLKSFHRDSLVDQVDAVFNRHGNRYFQVKQFDRKRSFSRNLVCLLGELSNQDAPL